MKKTDRGLMADALMQSMAKLSPRVQVRNPVMLVVYIGAVLTMALFFLSFAGIRDESAGYTLTISLILWFTVLFANFAEAIAEGRGSRAGEYPAQGAKGRVRAEAELGGGHHPPYRGALGFLEKGATLCMSRPGSKSPWTAKSSTARPPWTKAPSPANPRRSSGNPAAIAAPSPVAQRSYRTG